VRRFCTIFSRFEDVGSFENFRQLRRGKNVIEKQNNLFFGYLSSRVLEEFRVDSIKIPAAFLNLTDCREVTSSFIENALERSGSWKQCSFLVSEILFRCMNMILVYLHLGSFKKPGCISFANRHNIWRH
jgi:hypothetical protein